MILSIQKPWNDLDSLETVDFKQLAKEHLEASDYKILGYWDEDDNFYEEIVLNCPLDIELYSNSMGKTYTEDQPEYWIECKFILKAKTSLSQPEITSEVDKLIGYLTLIFDRQFQFIDEKWLIDIHSPFIVVNEKIFPNVGVNAVHPKRKICKHFAS